VKTGDLLGGKLELPFFKLFIFSELLSWAFDFLLIDPLRDLAGRLREVKSAFALWR
jgi:hypothetical protein